MNKLTIFFVVLAFALPTFAAEDRGVAVKDKASAPAAATELKTALVIGNSSCLSSPM